MTHATSLLERCGIELSERFVRSLLPMSIIGLDGTQLFANDAVCQLVSHSWSDLAGKPLAQLCCAAADTAVVEAVVRAAQAGDPGGRVLCDLQVSPARVLTTELTWTLITDAGGAPWYVTVAFHDETERIGAMRAAQRAAATFHARFEQSDLPQAMLDRAGRLTAVNVAFCELVGQPAADLLGCDVRSLAVRVAGRRLRDETLSQVLAGERDSARFEQLITGPGSQQVLVHVGLTMMRDASGNPFGAAVFLHDLTEVREQVRRREQEAAYYVALSLLSGDLAVVGDGAGTLLYVSPAVERVLGYTQAELTGAVAWDFVHPDDLTSARATYAAVVAGGGTQTFRLRLRIADGSWRWVEKTATNRLQDAIAGIVCNLRDVTEQVEHDLALRESEARFRAIAETANEGIWSLSPVGQTLYANDRMATILGVTLAELYTTLAMSLLDPADAADMAERLATGPERGAETYEIGIQHPSGKHRRLRIAASPLPGPDGSSIGSLAMVSDVTDARRVEVELRHAALHDALTGLPNRALFLDRLEHALTRGDGRTAVIFLDLDQFKLVNDSQGHAAGDELLVAVGQRLTSTVRPHDTVGRFGGDEFVVLAEDVDETAAEAIAQHLLDALAEPFVVHGHAVHITASVGVTLSPPASASDLLGYADTAMYTAKAAGRGRIRFFDPKLADRAEEQYVLSGRLRAALAADVLTMAYQAIIDLHSGQLLGVEALARWTDPDFGVIPPERFVKIGEGAGLAGVLDRWAVAHALREARVLRRAGAIAHDSYVSINLSARNVADSGLEDFIVTTTTSAGLRPQNVMLEITEGAVMRDAALAISLLRRLRARGFLLAIDDFGTGHSSLAYLRDLPTSILKIDQSFVSDIREDSDALAVVTSVVDLGRAVGMTVIAEGVETVEQSGLLRKLGCHAAQGWLWSPALPAAEILATRPWSSPFDVGPDRQMPSPGRRPGRITVKAEHGLDRLLAMHGKGASLATIAAALNRDGYATPNGLRWHQTSVARAVSDATSNRMIPLQT